MTVSSTRCCKNLRPEPHAPRRALALLLALVCLWCGLLGLPAPARAQAPQDITELALERTPDGLYLNAALHFDLPELAEDALYKGIAMYFVAEAEVVRERWYWYDKQVAQAVRHLRLSYQPLTRRWRLNVSPVPFDKTGLGVVLGQNYDELDDALAAMQRIARWKIAEASAVAPDTVYDVQLRFRLDLSQLPRPFQIGALGRGGWSLALSRSQRIGLEPPR